MSSSFLRNLMSGPPISKGSTPEQQSDFERLLQLCNSYGLNQQETKQLLDQFKKGSYRSDNNSFNQSIISQQSHNQHSAMEGYLNPNSHNFNSHKNSDHEYLQNVEEQAQQGDTFCYNDESKEKSLSSQFDSDKHEKNHQYQHEGQSSNRFYVGYQNNQEGQGQSYSEMTFNQLNDKNNNIQTLMSDNLLSSQIKKNQLKHQTFLHKNVISHSQQNQMHELAVLMVKKQGQQKLGEQQRSKQRQIKWEKQNNHGKQIKRENQSFEGIRKESLNQTKIDMGSQMCQNEHKAIIKQQGSCKQVGYQISYERQSAKQSRKQKRKQNQNKQSVQIRQTPIQRDHLNHHHNEIAKNTQGFSKKQKPSVSDTTVSRSGLQFDHNNSSRLNLKHLGRDQSCSFQENYHQSKSSQVLQNQQQQQDEHGLNREYIREIIKKFEILQKQNQELCQKLSLLENQNFRVKAQNIKINQQYQQLKEETNYLKDANFAMTKQRDNSKMEVQNIKEQSMRLVINLQSQKQYTKMLTDQRQKDSQIIKGLNDSILHFSHIIQEKHNQNNQLQNKVFLLYDRMEKQLSGNHDFNNTGHSSSSSSNYLPNSKANHDFDRESGTDFCKRIIPKHQMHFQQPQIHREREKTANYSQKQFYPIRDKQLGEINYQKRSEMNNRQLCEINLAKVNIPFKPPQHNKDLKRQASTQKIGSIANISKKPQWEKQSQNQNIFSPVYVQNPVQNSGSRSSKMLRKQSKEKEQAQYGGQSEHQAYKKRPSSRVDIKKYKGMIEELRNSYAVGLSNDTTSHGFR